MGTFVVRGTAEQRGIDKVDDRLVDIVRAAASRSPYDVELFSGKRYGGGNSRHDKGKAVDIVLSTPDGTKIPNIGSKAAFAIYEQFAKDVKAIQTQNYPELNDQMRWGGYFGPSGLNPTGFDYMHFDLKPGAAMAYGNFETGLNAVGQAALANLGLGKVYSSSGTITAEPGTYANLWGRERLTPSAPIGQSLSSVPRNEIADIQRTLNAAGYNVEVDGIAGAATQAAIADYQANQLNAARARMGMDPIDPNGAFLDAQTKVALSALADKQNQVPIPRPNPRAGIPTIGPMEADKARTIEAALAGKVPDSRPIQVPDSLVEALASPQKSLEQRTLEFELQQRETPRYGGFDFGTSDYIPGSDIQSALASPADVFGPDTLAGQRLREFQMGLEPYDAAIDDIGIPPAAPGGVTNLTKTDRVPNWDYAGTLSNPSLTEIALAGAGSASPLVGRPREAGWGYTAGVSTPVAAPIPRPRPTQSIGQMVSAPSGFSQPSYFEPSISQEQLTAKAVPIPRARPTQDFMPDFDFAVGPSDAPVKTLADTSVPIPRANPQRTGYGTYEAANAKDSPLKQAVERAATIQRSRVAEGEGAESSAVSAARNDRYSAPAAPSGSYRASQDVGVSSAAPGSFRSAQETGMGVRSTVGQYATPSTPAGAAPGSFRAAQEVGMTPSFRSAQDIGLTAPVPQAAAPPPLPPPVTVPTLHVAPPAASVGTAGAASARPAGTVSPWADDVARMSQGLSDIRVSNPVPSGLFSPTVTGKNSKDQTVRSYTDSRGIQHNITTIGTSRMNPVQGGFYSRGSTSSGSSSGSSRDSGNDRGSSGSSSGRSGGSSGLSGRNDRDSKDRHGNNYD